MDNGVKVRLSRREEHELVTTVSVLLGSRLDLSEAYRMAEATTDGRVARAARAIHRRIEHGEDLGSAATSTISRIDPVHAAMLRVADETGDAAVALARAAAYLGSRMTLRSRAMTAAIYPALIATATLVAAVVLVRVVEPAARELAMSMGAPNHASALVPVGDGSALVAPAGTVLALVTLCVAVCVAAVWAAPRRAPSFRRRLDRTIVALPVVGRMVVYRDMLSFAAAVAGMSRCGATLVHALTVGAACARNRTHREDLQHAAESVRRGESLAQALRPLTGWKVAHRWFALPDSGAGICESMDGLATFAEDRLQEAHQRMATLLEPALTLLAGLGVLLLVLKVVRPLFELYGGMLP